MCQDFGKDAKKKKDGHIEQTADSFIQFTEKCGHLNKGVCCYETGL